MILIENVRLIDNYKSEVDILIEKDRIIKIGKNLKDNNLKKDCTIIDGKNKIATPGLVNTHTHIPMTLFRGVADDIPLMEWLNNHIWKMEAKLTGEIVYWGTLLGCIEMIKSGTTTFNDMYFFIDDIIKATEESGLRATLSYGMIDLFDEEKREKELKESERVIKKIISLNNPKIKPSLGPHAPYTCSKELLTETKEMAKKYNVPIHIHMNETIDEVKKVKEMTDKLPFEYLHSIGFFDGTKCICAHCVHLSDEEINIIKNNNIGVSHNPISNLKLGSGIAPIPKLLKNNIVVSLGTDGCGSNNNLNLYEEIKLSSILHKGVSLNPTVVDSNTSFKMATENGAKLLGFKSGVIKEGYLADIVLIDLKKPYLIPNENIKSHLVYSFNGSVDTVIVGGEILLNEGNLTKLDEDKVYRMAEKCYRKLVD